MFERPGRCPTWVPVGPPTQRLKSLEALGRGSIDSCKYQRYGLRRPPHIPQGGSTYDNQLLISPEDVIGWSNEFEYRSLQLFVSVQGVTHFIGSVGPCAQRCGICRDTHYYAKNCNGLPVKPDNGYGFNSGRSAVVALLEQSRFYAHKGRWLNQSQWDRLQRKLPHQQPKRWYSL